MIPASVIVINDFAHATGGADEVAIKTALLCKRAGMDVVFFGCVPPVDSRLEACGVKAVHLGQKACVEDNSAVRGALRGLWNREVMEGLKKSISLCENTPIAHVHSYTKALSPSVFAYLRRLGVPSLLTVHDQFVVCPNGGFIDYKHASRCHRRPLGASCVLYNCDKRNYAQKVYRCVRQVLLNRELDKLSPRIAWVSEFNRELVRGSNKKLDEGVVIENPVDELGYHPVDAWKNEMVFAYVGRASFEKGVEVFCKGIRLAGVKGVAIGEGPEIKRLSVEYPEVRFVGYMERSEMRPLLSEVRGCIFPSVCFEAAPLVPREVMAAYGLPFIVADGCAAKDYIVDGETGFLFRSGDEQSLGDAISRFNDDETVEHLCSNVRAQFGGKASREEERYLSEIVSAYRETLRGLR